MTTSKIQDNKDKDTNTDEVQSKVNTKRNIPSGIYLL